jgi:hypothetical protein
MWLERFFELIDRSSLGVAIEKRRALLEYTGEPARIYIENVRAFLGVSHGMARALCELAVRTGLFERCEAVLCPHDKRVLLDACEPDDLPEADVACGVCESLEIEPHVFNLRECQRLPFYRLRDADA